MKSLMICSLLSTLALCASSQAESESSHEVDHGQFGAWQVIEETHSFYGTMDVYMRQVTNMGSSEVRLTCGGVLRGQGILDSRYYDPASISNGNEFSVMLETVSGNKIRYKGVSSSTLLTDVTVLESEMRSDRTVIISSYQQDIVGGRGNFLVYPISSYGFVDAYEAMKSYCL